MEFSIHTEIIAYHGWGFDASCWSNWELRLRQQNCKFKLFDRGYWEQHKHPEFEHHRPTKIILAHSYGLHLCPVEQLKQADALVIFSSFSEFHPQPTRLRTRSQQMLQQMIKQFEINPNLVLSNFQAKCYHPEVWAGILPNQFDSQINPRLMLADLISLDSATLDLMPLGSIPQIVILHGSQDRIVAPSQGKELAEQLPQSRFIQIEAAGHALPFTHQQDCWSVLQPILEILPV